jgi:hypothetical protein
MSVVRILVLWLWLEGEPVNRWQMDIKRKTCDIRTWKKHMLLYMSSTNTDTLAPSFYQCVETRSIEVFWLLSQPLPHLRFNLFVISETFAMFLDPVVNCFTQQTLPAINRKHFFMNILCIESFCAQQKCRTERCSSVIHTQALPSFWLLKPASEHTPSHLLPRLQWSWTLLLLSDARRKPITSITAVLLPSVTYLLTVSRTYWCF